ncbi:CLUMA_CG004399, isoform A [Clunio marinus]|uniref:CLUMA_CG004399, isoform A n=1 Tax=Clunio marinus TaxID=568069 RepID=A0A1J1HT26_9DIPT|nr:CLUMA_CG004399, isoform A [Clunio marinus]
MKRCGSNVRTEITIQPLRELNNGKHSRLRFSVLQPLKRLRFMIISEHRYRELLKCFFFRDLCYVSIEIKWFHSFHLNYLQEVGKKRFEKLEEFCIV